MRFKESSSFEVEKEELKKKKEIKGSDVWQAVA